MGLAADVRNEVRKLADHKAVYAAAGAGDLALEKLRNLRRFGRLHGKADLAELSGRALEYVMEAGARAVQAYDELAERGLAVVDRVNTLSAQQAAAELEQAAASTAGVTARAADAARAAAHTTARAVGRAAAKGAAGASGAADPAGGSASANGASASKPSESAHKPAGSADKPPASAGKPATSASKQAGYQSTASRKANGRAPKKHSA